MPASWCFSEKGHMAAARVASLDGFLGLGLQLDIDANREGNMKMRVSVTSTSLVACGRPDRLRRACMAQSPKRRWRAM